jgi:hypothetical protein
MTMKLNLPSGHSLCQLLFTGAAVPSGAAISFDVLHSVAGLDPVGVATQVISLYGTHLKATITPDVTLAGVRVKQGPMETGPFALVSANVPGTDTGASDAPPVALLVRKNTAAGGKSGSGRMYVPGLGSTRVTVGGDVQTSDITTRQTAWTAFLAALTAAQIPMFVAHTFGTYVNSKGETVTVPAVSPTPVTNLAVQSRAATQRRRQRR